MLRRLLSQSLTVIDGFGDILFDLLTRLDHIKVIEKRQVLLVCTESRLGHIRALPLADRYDIVSVPAQGYFA